MRLIIIIVFILFSLVQLHSQDVLSGHLFDVVNQKDIPRATVYNLNKNLETTTDDWGNFAFKYGEVANSKIQFFKNTIIWKGDREIKFQIASLDGKTLLNFEIRSGEIFILPRMRTGVYILMIKENSHSSFYKIVSDGNESLVADKRAMYMQGQVEGIGYDTILIEKPGYYSRTVTVPNRNSFEEIGLLNGVNENLEYFNELISPIAYELISSNPSRTNLGDVSQVKIIYDTKTDLLYYMNTNKYTLHLDFAVNILKYKNGHYYFNQTQYTDNPNRYLYLASLNYYKGIDQYVLQYVAAVEMTCEQIEVLYDKILETSFIEKERLKFFPIKAEWELCEGIEKVSSEELYQGQNYQGLNVSTNYGYLTKVSSDEIESTYLSRREIVLTNGVPNDLPVVAGIITSELQTPLSHINVLSHSRNTPNMALREAWDNEELNQLIGKLVYLDVRQNQFELREATLEEATGFWLTNEPQDTIFLARDLAYKELVSMTDANFTYLNKIGGKASNFSELLNVRTVYIPTPENAFAIPFSYYNSHLVNNQLDEKVKSFLEDPTFQADADYRKMKLEELRESIINSSIDPDLVNLVRNKIDDFSEFQSYRFRSSTNAEDLEIFSGAGLYDSYSAKKGHSTKTIEMAIKKVWASLWNWRAFEERSYFKIDHLSCAMGILVHRSFPDEDANGVLVTKNLYNSNPGYIINVQHEEYSIVFPKPGIINDQMILFTWSINANEDFTLEYLSFSNVAGYEGKRVMTDAEVFELGVYATEIKKRFYYELPHNCACTFNDFGVDIEFKVDSQVSPRKIYVKQARLYD